MFQICWVLLLPCVQVVSNLKDCVEACKSLTAVPGRMDVVAKEGAAIGDC